jgi:hypothetical protein
MWMTSGCAAIQNHPPVAGGTGHFYGMPTFRPSEWYTIDDNKQRDLFAK